MRNWLGLVSVLVVMMVCPAAVHGQWTTALAVAPRVQYLTFQSAAAGATVSFHVYTPPLYDTQSERRFPVLYWLHGSGSPTAGIPPMSNWFAGAMSRGQLRPMIIVFPNGMPNGMYCDAADGTQPIETVIMQELIPLVDATFRTIADRRGRILEGFSMGGYGAGRLGFKYSDRFAAISMLGAGPVQLDFMNPPPGTNVSPATRAAIFEDVWNSDPALFFSASPWNLAQVNRAAILDNRPLVRMAVGDADAMLGPNADLRAHLLQLGIPHSWQTAPGVGHDTLALLQSLGPTNWDFYRAALPCPLDFNSDGFLNQEDLGGYLTAFLAEPSAPGPSGTSSAPCPDEPAPYDTLGYAADFNRDCAFNQEDLVGFITEYFLQAENPTTCVPG